MQYRRLGRSGLQVSALSFGSWVSFHKQIDDSRADELMGIAYDAGVNFFDNAEVYANGESERMMGRVLKQKNWDRTSYCISSKVYFGHRGIQNKPNQTGLSRKHIMEACHEALQRLQVEYLDLFFCHRPDKNTPIEETVLAMNTLIQQGKIFYWGTSEWSAAEIMEAHRVSEKYRLIGPTMEQPQYNLFEREKMEKEFLPVFKHVGLGTTIWSPLASGLLTGKYNRGLPAGSRLALEGFGWLQERWMVEEKIEKVKKLGKLAKQLHCSLAQLSIAWCLHNTNVSTVILGATKANQLEENLNTLSILETMPDEVIHKIEKIMNNKPIQPAF